MNQYQSFAHRLHEQGFNLTAIKAGEKRPGHPWDAWQETRQTLDDLNAFPWLAAGGIGIVGGIGGFHSFDFDRCADFGPVAAVLEQLGLPTSYPWAWRSGSGSGYGIGILCFDALPPSILATNGNGPGVFKAAGVGFDHLELRWARCQTVLPPSAHPTGPGYAWISGEPTDPPANVTAAQVIAAFRAVTVAPTPKISQPTHEVRQPTGTGYAAAALRSELDHLGRAIEGTRNNTLNAAALHVGEFVAGGELDRADVERQLFDVALRIGLGEHEARATIRSGLDAGARNPRTAPEPERRPAAVSSFRDTPEEPPWLANAPEPPYVLGGDGAPMPAPAISAPKSTKELPKLEVLSIRDLLTRTWPEPPWAVPGLLPVGLTVLAGRPKIGKSWLALQLVQYVTTGGVFLGRKVDRGSCLYLALEDPPGRLAERARLQGWSDLDARADFLPVGSFRRGDGRQLAGIIRERGYRLVVVDTLARAFTGDKNSGDDMTAQLTPVQEAAHAANCAVVLIHHFNKLGAATTGTATGITEPDPLINLQGSVSIGGMADCIVGLYRQADKRGIMLTGYGRDVEEYTLNLVFDRATHCWQAMDADAPKQTDERAQVLAVIENLGPSTLSEINAILKTDKGNLYKRLQNMMNLGMLDKSGPRYGIPTE